MLDLGSGGDGQFSGDGELQRERLGRWGRRRGLYDDVVQLCLLLWGACRTTGFSQTSDH